jgi:hypothetical protein
MGRRMAHMWGLIGVLAITACAAIPRSPGSLWEIRISEHDAQRQIAAAFPWEHQVVLRDRTVLIVSLSQPWLTLLDGDDRLRLRVRLGWYFPEIHLGSRLPVLRPGFTTGWLDASGRLGYRPKAGEFYLQDIALHDSHVPGLPARYEPEVRQVLEVVANAYLSDVPVYSLRDRG